MNLWIMKRRFAIMKIPVRTRKFGGKNENEVKKTRKWSERTRKDCYKSRKWSETMYYQESSSRYVRSRAEFGFLWVNINHMVNTYFDVFSFNTYNTYFHPYFGLNLWNYANLLVLSFSKVNKLHNFDNFNCMCIFASG